MDPTSEAVGALVNLIPLVWNKLQEELALAASAELEFVILEKFHQNIGCLVNEAYLKEVIEGRPEPGIKIMQKFLYDSEDAIEDLGQCESTGKSFLRRLYDSRNFTVESRNIQQRWIEYIANFGLAPTGISNGSTNNHAPSSSASHRPSSIAFSEETDDTLVGIKGPMKQLVRLLTEGKSTENPEKSKVVFVHGAQGVGKTSLVAAVLRHQSVRSRFKYCVWIEDLRSCELADQPARQLMKANATMWDLTMKEVNGQGRPLKLGTVKLEDAFRQMKQKAELPANNFSWRWGRPKKKNNFSWALVLDDAGRADVFEFLQVCLSETRPSVLVTTRVASLISSSMDHVEAQYDPCDFKHVLLFKNDSRSLFYRQMKDTYGDLLLECEKSPSLKDASDLILRRCKGLPLAILSTCKLLKYNRKHDVSGHSDAVQWKKSSSRLEEELLSGGHEVGLNGRMLTLRMDHFLDVRGYLFYLSIFPLDRPIKWCTITRLWIAEGFIKQEGSQPIQAKADKILDKLLEHNVIWEKRAGHGRVKTFRVHNLLHQTIISKSKAEGFAMIVANPNERLPENVRYLSYHSPMNIIDNVTSVNRLRSLHVFKELHPATLKELLKNVERLKVLDIQRHLTEEEKKRPPASLDTFPQKILRSKYLTYLSLRGTDVKSIPEGVKELVYLESLDLRDTLVDELPKGILKLKKLCHLLVSRSSRRRAVDIDLKVGVKAPSKLGDLTTLQKLCMIEVEPVKRGKQWERGELLKELGKLTNLQRLGLSMLKSTDGKLLCSSIKELTNLEALRLTAAPGEMIDLPEQDLGQALKGLQQVHLTGGLGTLPRWILRSDILVKLVLKRSQLTVNALQQLGDILCLKHLELEQAFDTITMRFKAKKFQQLRFLSLDGFDKLQIIEVDDGALPTLERLSLARCDSLKDVPQFITSHTKLKCLELWDMPQEFDRAVKVIIEQVGEHMKVKSKKWKDPVVEEAITLSKRGASIPWVPRPFKK
ncbi:hypothetical protein BT93_H1359 [Corymbia citriodora subsp. variegata]|nr:hypothetical protein BT93_H1359 [Corymbia citriodora subsp. variegata]